MGKPIFEKIIQQPLNYYILAGLLLIGFFLRLDYSDRFGCIRFQEPIFEFKNILFSAISITLVLFSFFAKRKNTKMIFISVELLFWLFKFFIFKGGYVVGIAASPDPFITLFDVTTLTFRLLIIRSLLDKNIKPVYFLLCALVIIAIKVYIFPVPYL